MAISDFPEIIVNSLSSPDLELALNDFSTVQLRGSNFQQNALVFTNSLTNERWLWKTNDLNTIIKEYVISQIAQELGISVPKTYIARKGATIGLLHEWINDSTELKDTQSNLLDTCGKKNIIHLLLLEVLIGASDRHGGNYLFSKGKIYGIDFEKSFSEEYIDSELSLYFEWLKDSKETILQEIDNFKQKIINQEIIRKSTDLIQALDNFPIDERAKIAIETQIVNICSFLHTNLDKLPQKIHTYFLEPSAKYLWFS